MLIRTLGIPRHLVAYRGDNQSCRILYPINGLHALNVVGCLIYTQVQSISSADERLVHLRADEGAVSAFSYGPSVPNSEYVSYGRKLVTA